MQSTRGSSQFGHGVSAYSQDYVNTFHYDPLKQKGRNASKSAARSTKSPGYLDYIRQAASSSVAPDSMARSRCHAQHNVQVDPSQESSAHGNQHHSSRQRIRTGRDIAYSTCSDGRSGFSGTLSKTSTKENRARNVNKQAGTFIEYSVSEEFASFQRQELIDASQFNPRSQGSHSNVTATQHLNSLATHPLQRQKSTSSIPRFEQLRNLKSKMSDRRHKRNFSAGVRRKPELETVVASNSSRRLSSEELHQRLMTQRVSQMTQQLYRPQATPTQRQQSSRRRAEENAIDYSAQHQRQRFQRGQHPNSQNDDIGFSNDFKQQSLPGSRNQLAGTTSANTPQNHFSHQHEESLGTETASQGIPEFISKQDLRQCNFCLRTFNKETVEKHERICQKNKQDRSGRQVFNIRKQRLNISKLESDRNIIQSSLRTIGKQNTKASSSKKANWKLKSRQLRVIARATTNQASDQTHADDLQDVPNLLELGYQQCPHCNRTFNENAAERHIPKCKDLKAKPTRLFKGAGRYASKSAKLKKR